MASVVAETFNDHVERILGGRLPEELDHEIPFARLSPDAQGVALRLLALMRRSGCAVTEFNAQMIWLLAAVTPSMLPAAWGGRIPPLTSPGRHRKLDTYVHHQIPSTDNNGRPLFIDLGCGFPPVTAVDTARTLPGWSVCGVDRSFHHYVLYDADGCYACFNRDGVFQYVQSPGKPLNDTPEAVKARFQSLFTELRPLLDQPRDGRSAAVARDGCKLIADHVRDFERENLTFVKADIDALQLRSARFVRCMNMLLYFPKDDRKRMLTAMGALLDEDGLMMTGFNHPFGIYARYAVYSKEVAGIRPCEFAFSMDNLRPLGIGPWLTLVEDDREAALLADLTGAIRADRIFWSDFTRRVDALQAQYGIATRDPDGFLHYTEEARTASPLVVTEKTTALWEQVATEGYAEGAVAALNRAGYNAWLNAVGDIAVSPPEQSLDIF